MVATATALHDHWSATVTAVNLQPRHLPIAAQQGACARQATVLARAIPANQGTWCCDLGHFFPRSRSSNRAWRALPSSISCQLGNATRSNFRWAAILQSDRVPANGRLQEWPTGPNRQGLGQGRGSVPAMRRSGGFAAAPNPFWRDRRLPAGPREGLATRPALPEDADLPLTAP
jgi:hypothetical protein